MKEFVIFLFSILMIACSSTKRGSIIYGEDGKILSGNADLKCERPLKRYAKELEFKVKTEIAALSSIPQSNLESELARKVVKLSDYTSIGLDKDLILFRICEMSINRGLTSDQTVKLIDKAIDSWGNGKLIRSFNNNDKKIINDILNKHNHKLKDEILIQYSLSSPDGQSYSKAIAEYVIARGYKNTSVQAGMVSGENETEFRSSKNSIGTLFIILPIRRP